MARRIPIRRKLAAALAIPITALLVVAGLEVAQSLRERDEVAEQTELATASIGPSGLITAIQNERNYGAVWLLGFEGRLQLPVKTFDEAKAATDEAITSFRADIERKGGDAEETYAPALDALDGLEEVRGQVDTYEGERALDNTDASDPVFQTYTDIVQGLFDANSQVALAVDDPVLRRGVELTDIASRQTDVIARTIRSLLLSGLSPGGLDQPEEIAEASGLFGQVLINESQAQSLGTGIYEPLARELKQESDATGFVVLAQQTIDEGGEVPIEDILGTVDIDQSTSWYGFRHSVEDTLLDRADELNAAATRTMIWFLVLAGVAAAVALGVTWLVSRSITKPLRSLTGQAKVMADHRLPEAVIDILDTPLGEDVEIPEVDPVAVQTRDEVSDVADALNTVQDSALDLAVEQAVLRRNIADSFVNLGRRNQNLLGRQLDFITELETNETNPDTLANLFRLDHLAPRMRRNAESLLVLAGIEPPRKWASPVRLTDVIRAALGEVEDYQRVSVRGVEPATIVGSGAADLAHLLAELIENSLVFSPPDQSVDIRGRNRPARAAEGADGMSGYTLAIIDSGLGMTPSDIESANRRLAGAESFTIAPSKYLGHYVAGNLAARHDIGVHLDNSPGNGVTAAISIPPALLTTDAVLDEQPPARASQVATSTNGSHPPAPLFPVAAAPALDPTPTPPPRGLAPPSRTASGLVKRAPRPSPEPESPAASMPAGDLLASLSHVAGNLGERGRGPVLPPTPPGHAPPPGQVPAHLARRTPPGPGTPPGPDTPPWSPPAGQPLPPPAPPAPGRGQVHGQDQTPSGLARRVRGAQLPTTQPLSLRRSGEHPPVGDGDHRPGDRGAAHQGPSQWNGDGNGNGHVGPREQDDHSSARDVYSFLTSFTAGVQRGLDEAGHDTTPPEENP